MTDVSDHSILGEQTMKAKKITFYCLLGLVAGCVPIVSLQPLFTKEDIVFDEKLLGAWVEEGGDSGTSWEFARFEESAAGSLPEALRSEFKQVYRLNLANKEGRKGSLAACLVTLGDRRFLDVFPDQFPSGESDTETMKLSFNAFFFVPSHTFARVDAAGDQLKIQFTDDDEFKKLVEVEPKAVAHVVTEDHVVLTGSTGELQAFVTKYADDKRLFAHEITLVRKSK
jgi:hypothetical protein